MFNASQARLNAPRRDALDLQAEQALSSWELGLNKDTSSNLVGPNLLDVLLVTHGEGVGLVSTHDDWVLPDRLQLELGFDARHALHFRKDHDGQTRLRDGFGKVHIVFLTPFKTGLAHHELVKLGHSVLENNRHVCVKGPY